VVGSVLIIVFSLLLLAYWFRYTCLLLLNQAEEEIPAAATQEMAQSNHLSFVRVRQMLREGSQDLSLESLHGSLKQDYKVLQYLVRHTPDLEMTSFERHLLDAHYRIMNLWFRATRRSSASLAHKALLEMSSVVFCFAREMGRRAESPSRA